MTVSEMRARMDYPELLEWIALDVLRADEAKAADRQARKGMRPR